MTLNPYVSTKKPIAKKSLRKFSETLDVKNKINVCGFGAANSKLKAIKKAMCGGQKLKIAVVIHK